MKTGWVENEDMRHMRRTFNVYMLVRARACMWEKA